MTNEPATPGIIAPGCTIGMVGSGQLGRMTAMAAAPLDYRVHVYADQAHSPTAQVCGAETIGEWDDRDHLAEFGRSVDVVTYEWENLPVASLEFLQRFCPVRPSPEVLAVAQDRVVEKQFVNQAGASTAEFVEANSLDELADAVATIGVPCVVKSARFGYDGLGQARIGDADDIEHAWRAIGERRAVVEQFVDYTCEMSVVVVRSASGQIAVYDPVLNNHVEGILETTEAPAPTAPEICRRAVDIGRLLAEAFGLVGVLAVELFVTHNDGLLVNEVAPRPHNSGHWTIDGCHTSQFEQFVRAICNLPLGSPARHADAVMHNLIGPIGKRWLSTLEDPRACLHLYGKRRAYPGRKMGHITYRQPLSDVDYAELDAR